MHHSPALERFLECKRDPNFIPGPPEVIPSNDCYLREFQDEKARTIKADQVPRTDEQREIEEDLQNLVSTKDALSYLNESLLNKCQLPLRLFNLPYAADQSDIAAWGCSLGISLLTTDIQLDINSLTNTSQGTATILVRLAPPPGLSVDAEVFRREKDWVVGRLQGRELLGRTIRVQRKDPINGAGTVQRARYYATGSDVGKKCVKCMEVGHTERFCTNFESWCTRCHLCAGNDHEAAECPNLICHRCGLFGHHSRMCPEAPVRFCSSRSRAFSVICSLCGSNEHDYIYCMDEKAYMYGKTGVPPMACLDFDPAVVCMVCGEPGHAMCDLPQYPIPVPTDGQVYCPVCAGEGHFLDDRLCATRLVDGADESPSFRSPGPLTAVDPQLLRAPYSNSSNDSTCL